MSTPALVFVVVKAIDHVATGAAMRAARKKAGLSLRTVAGKLGYSVPYVSDLELGRTNWTEAKVSKFLDALK